MGCVIVPESLKIGCRMGESEWRLTCNRNGHVNIGASCKNPGSRNLRSIWSQRIQGGNRGCRCMRLVVISDHDRICDCLSDHFMRMILNRKYDSGDSVSTD